MTYYMFIYVLGVAVFLLAVRLYLAVESWVSANGETPDRPDWLPVELTALFALGMMPGAQLLYACFHEGKSNGLWGGYAVFAGLLLPYLLLRKVSREAVLDSVALAVPAGLAVAKLACLYAGCCHGAETSVGWALRHDSSLIAPRGVPLHPTQLYDAGVFFATGVTVTALTACSVLRGRLVLVATAMMGIGRLTTGFFRGDTPPALGALSVAQWVALACALAAIAALVVPALRNAWAYVVVSEGGPEPDAWIHETQGSGAFAQAAGTYAAILFAPLAALYLAIRALSLLVAGGTGGGRSRADELAAVSSWLLLTSAGTAASALATRSLSGSQAKMVAGRFSFGASGPLPVEEAVAVCANVSDAFFAATAVLLLLAIVMTLRIPRERSAA